LPEYSCLEELKEHYQRGGLGDVTVKKFLNHVMQSELAPIRERRKMWEQRLPEVFDILKEGTRTAREVAAETLCDVRHAMKIDYFTDDNLLK
ncbi:MAG: tryptophan--tRNA ligase, partial [Eubacteriales bacterium]|nr:tryptophan--tRNA ligase [Eubacteriales bacterium]